jgi:hypothetical protein
VKRLLVFVAAALAFGAAPSPESASPELAAGITRVQEGDFEGGVITLDGAARLLRADPGRTRELAEAYLYLGIAYLELAQEPLAQAKFRQALALDAALRMGEGEFPPKVRRAFDSARVAVEEAATLEREAKKPRGRAGLVLLGVGGAAAAGIAVAAASAPETNHAPVASVAITPEGQALPGVTKLAFTATSSDADGDPVSYNWTFGDGATASGPIVDHVYETPGSFEVTLAASDGPQTTVVSTRVIARPLTGSWQATIPGLRGTTTYTLQHLRAEIGGFAASGNRRFGISARVTNPRHVRLSYSETTSGGRSCLLEIVGDAGAGLDTISGIEYCTGCLECGPGQQAPIALRRQ